MDYTKKMKKELNGLRIENYDYFKKMVSYAGYRGYFCDGEALSETLYNMVCDLKEVERDGLTAEEFFGKDPKSMMDQIIAESPKRRLGEYIKLTLVIFALTLQMRLSPLYLGWFCSFHSSGLFGGFSEFSHLFVGLFWSLGADSLSEVQ